MNIWCFLLTRFSKIFFDEKFGWVFALKHATKPFNYLSSELFKPYEKTESLTKSLKSLAKCLKNLDRLIKRLGHVFAL